MTPERFDVLARWELFAPRIMWSESCSAIHEAGHRGDMAPQVARSAFEAIADASIRPFGDLELHRQAWEVAEQLGWARTYDAEYVALALRLQCPLLTVDARLARGGAKLVQMLDPSEV